MSSSSTISSLAIPTREIRVGVIGTGFGATAHLPALQNIPYVSVTAICSKQASRAREVADRHGIAKSTVDYRELMRDSEIDAVVIASPPNLHHPMAFTALERGKHILVEKPLSRTLAEARDLVRLAKQAGVVGMVNHEFRFEPARAQAKELLESSYIGDPHMASVTVYRSTLNDPHGVAWDWLMESDKGGGMLAAAGSHYLDALRWWFGEVSAVAGSTHTMIRERHHAGSTEMGEVSADDNFAILLKFQSGAMATVTYSATASFEAGEQIILSGSEGMLLMTSDRKLYGSRIGGRLNEIPISERLTSEISTFSDPLTGPTSLLLRNWIGAIRTGQVAAPSFEDGLKVQELMDGAVRSSQLGRWVEIAKGRFPRY